MESQSGVPIFGDVSVHLAPEGGAHMLTGIGMCWVCSTFSSSGGKVGKDEAEGTPRPGTRGSDHDRYITQECSMVGLRSYTS